MKKIYIDAGHGGSNPGASYKNRTEQADVFRLAEAVKNILQRFGDIEVKLSRAYNEDPSIAARANEANAWGADYFISIHRNAIGANIAKGAENWCYSKVAAGGETYKKAQRILELLCEKTGFVNRGVKLGAPAYTDFGVNSLTNMSSCLLEAGFIDSDTDNAIFDGKFDAMAEGIAQGLVEAVGITWEEAAPVPDDEPEANDHGAKTDGAIYTVQTGAFKNRKLAETLLSKAKAAGFTDAFITVKGDMDGDSKITAADARDVLRQSVGM